MTHDKIKAAARRRMAASGEPYTLARRAAISRHSEATSTSAVSPEDVRAAAAVEHDLGPAYSDAVVAAFVDRVDREVAARVEARVNGRSADRRAQRLASRRPRRRRVIRDAVAAGAGALAVASAVGIYGLTGTGAPTRPRPAAAAPIVWFPPSTARVSEIVLPARPAIRWELMPVVLTKTQYHSGQSRSAR